MTAPPEVAPSRARVDGGDRSLGLLRHLAPRATILVEGDRGPQRSALEAELDNTPHLTCEVRTLRTSSDGMFLGGCSLIRVRPRLHDRVAWLRDRLATAWVYRRRAHLARS